MKKRASANKLGAKKTMMPRAAAKPVAARASRPAEKSDTAQRAPAESERAKYTPAPLKSDGWPAFRYPLS